jgi:hypothetical protein
MNLRGFWGPARRGCGISGGGDCNQFAFRQNARLERVDRAVAYDSTKQALGRRWNRSAILGNGLKDKMNRYGVARGL